MKRFFYLIGLLLAASVAQAQTMVRLHTTQGPIDISLYDSQAPVTVNNFLGYVRSGGYADSFFHRSVRSFVIQGGGYRWPETGGVSAVTSRGTIVNEFSASRSNVRGTVAMAKVGGDPNSATSQWFVNLNNNAANLDTQNGGFTVFGKLTTPGLATADAIGALQIVNAGGAFSELPVVNFSGSTIQRQHVVRITEITEFPAQRTESDRIFNYLEAAYPQYLSPSKGAGGVSMGYTFRYYSGSNAYVGTKDDQVWYLVPAISSEVRSLGAMSTWLSTAAAAGY